MEKCHSQRHILNHLVKTKRPGKSAFLNQTQTYLHAHEVNEASDLVNNQADSEFAFPSACFRILRRLCFRHSDIRCTAYSL